VGGRHANCYSDQDPSTTTLIIIFPEWGGFYSDQDSSTTTVRIIFPEWGGWVGALK
jgi:hypothetical protein